MRNLRNEIAPIPGEVRSRGIPLGQDPEAVGDDFGVLFPPVKIDVVDPRGFDFLDSALKPLQIVTRAFDGAPR